MTVPFKEIHIYHPVEFLYVRGMVAMMVDDILLRLKDVSKDEEGKGKKKALKRVNLNISKGDFISIIEKQSSDRDLLFRLISLIEPPTSGRIMLGSKEVSGLKEKDLTKLRLRHMGIVFMHNYFVDELSIRENIEIFLKEAGIPKKEIAKRVSKALETVGLHDRAEFKPTELSKYELKAADIARALAKRPSLLLVNEPPLEANGDGRTIIDLIKRVQRKRPLAVVFTTTSQRLGKRARRAFLLKDGILKEILAKK